MQDCMALSVGLWLVKERFCFRTLNRSETKETFGSACSGGRTRTVTHALTIPEFKPAPFGCQHESEEGISRQDQDSTARRFLVRNDLTDQVGRCSRDGMLDGDVGEVNVALALIDLPRQRGGFKLTHHRVFVFCSQRGGSYEVFVQEALQALEIFHARLGFRQLEQARQVPGGPCIAHHSSSNSSCCGQTHAVRRKYLEISFSRIIQGRNVSNAAFGSQTQTIMCTKASELLRWSSISAWSDSAVKKPLRQSKK
jgi:hypothetical protein